MGDAKDWRLTNQESYLKGAPLVWQRYAPARPDNDHDHCEFCWAKFMASPDPDVLTEGYCTQDRERWVCQECFDDFVDLFGWQVQ